MALPIWKYMEYNAQSYHYRLGHLLKIHFYTNKRKSP